MKENLNEQGYDLEKIPYVMQYNKRDLPNAVPIKELKDMLNGNGALDFESVANKGVGVFDTLKSVVKLVLTELKKGV
jgi:hypothetical protein